MAKTMMIHTIKMEDTGTTLMKDTILIVIGMVLTSMIDTIGIIDTLGIQRLVDIPRGAIIIDIISMAMTMIIRTIETTMEDTIVIAECTGTETVISLMMTMPTDITGFIGVEMVNITDTTETGETTNMTTTIRGQFITRMGMDCMRDTLTMTDITMITCIIETLMETITIITGALVITRITMIMDMGTTDTTKMGDTTTIMKDILIGTTGIMA